MNIYEHYLVEAQNADLSYKKTFGRIVQTGLELAGISLSEAADMFDTAPGTVSRWANGYSAPPDVARGIIVAMLISKVRRTLAEREKC